jgi:hypothetical protein
MDAIKGIGTWLEKVQAKYTSSVTQQAEYLIELTEIKTLVEEEIAKPWSFLLKKKETVVVPEKKMKVLYMPEEERSEINVAGLFEQMKKDGRLKDFLEVCSVSQTALKTLEDGESLIADFRVILDKKKSETLSVRALSKKELKEMNLE